MFDRTSFVVLGMAGAFALGLALGPQLSANRLDTKPPGAAATSSASAVVEAEEPTPVRTAAPRLERVLPASAKPVQKQVKLLLNRGADVQAAARGFQNARELMTVAHAARNTDIPFILLKHRVLTERKSLAVAIREFKPELNAIAEVNRARAEAKADLARMPS
jgi:hypothetical protein